VVPGVRGAAIHRVGRISDSYPDLKHTCRTAAAGAKPWRLISGDLLVLSRMTTGS
jgi:hypothetical protein